MLKRDVAEAIRREKLIVIVRGVELRKTLRLCEALYAGGVRLVECTFDMKREESLDETAEKIAAVTEAFEGRILVGAGTVLTTEEAEAACRAGAKYLISPDTNEGVIRYANEHGLVSIPGAMTPTEIAGAYRMGADFVKVFPNAVMGLDYIKAVRAPLSAIPLLAVGGVNAENIRQFLDAGVEGVGIGNGIVKKQLVAEENWDAITELAKKMTDAIKG